MGWFILCGKYLTNYWLIDEAGETRGCKFNYYKLKALSTKQGFLWTIPIAIDSTFIRRQLVHIGLDLQLDSWSEEKWLLSNY